MAAAPDLLDPPEGGWKRPDPALLRLRRRVAVGAVGPPVLVLGAVAGLLQGPVAALAAVVAGAALLGTALAVVQRRVAAWGYLERPDDLLVRRGVLVRRVSLVPYGRLQYVDVVAGPLDRRYGLATVTLHTAAASTDAVVPGLRADEAARLRDRLAALGEARQAGL